MKDNFDKQNYNVAYVDGLPDCCMNCPFMCVDNKVWYNGTYNTTQSTHHVNTFNNFKSKK